MTIAEAAVVLSVSKRTMHEIVKSVGLTKFRVGNKYMLVTSEVMKLSGTMKAT